MSQLPFGWVCFSNNAIKGKGMPGPAQLKSQLPFGWVCFSNAPDFRCKDEGCEGVVSIAFRLGLFL